MATSASTVVSREGKISLPASQRRATGISPGSRVSVHTEGTKIIVQSMDAMLDELEERARILMTGSNDSVDKFLADKYAEAALEYED